MEKLDTVVTGLGACIMGLCQSCPYGEYGTPRCKAEVMVDAHNTIVRLREKLAESGSVVRARWEFYMDETGDWWDKCSACGGKLPNEGGYCCGLPRCPYCGAHMDEEVTK